MSYAIKLLQDIILNGDDRPQFTDDLVYIEQGCDCQYECTKALFRGELDRVETLYDYKVEFGCAKECSELLKQIKDLRKALNVK